MDPIQATRIQRPLFHLRNGAKASAADRWQTTHPKNRGNYREEVVAHPLFDSFDRPLLVLRIESVSTLLSDASVAVRSQRKPLRIVASDYVNSVAATFCSRSTTLVA
jgi:hypothetical protein